MRDFLRDLPPDDEIDNLLRSISDISHVPLALDRYTVIIGAAAVEGALFRALQRSGHSAPDATFHGLIRQAEKSGLINDIQTADLNSIRELRNQFSHHVNELSLENKQLRAMLNQIRSYPITNWAAYFAPAFKPRDHFLILCKQYRALLQPRA